MQALSSSRPGTDFGRFLLHILPLCFTGYHEGMLHGPAEAVPGMPQILHRQITLNLKCNTTTGLLRTCGHITRIEYYFYFNKREVLEDSLKISWNHRMLLVGRDLKDHFISNPLRWAETPFTRPGCLKPHPSWP